MRKTTGNVYFYELNFIRAFACLCVVMVHVSADVYYYKGAQLTWSLQFFNQMARFGTPLFAFLSGFLLYNQLKNGRFKLSNFLKSRCTKIVLPFLIWSVIYVCVKRYDDQITLPHVDQPEEVKQFLYTFLTGGTYYHLYFIALVLQFYILFPFLRFISSKNSLIILTVISFLLNYFFVQFPIDFGTGFVHEFINSKVFILHWIFYFILGGLFVHYWESMTHWMKENQGTALLLGLIVFVGGMIEYSFVDWIQSNRIMNMFNVPLLVVALSGLYYKLSILPVIRNTMIKLGNLSMGIYLTHPLILFILYRLDVVEFLYTRDRYLPILFTLTVLLSVLLVMIISKLPFGQYIVTIAQKRKR